MPGRWIAIALAVLAHALSLIAADRWLPTRASLPAAPVEIELDMAPPPPPPPVAAVAQEPAPLPVRATIPPTTEPTPAHATPPRPRAVIETTVPPPTPTPAERPPAAPGVLSMRSGVDPFRPAETPFVPGSFSIDGRPDYRAPPAEGVRDPLGPLPEVAIPGEHVIDHGELRPDGDGKRMDDQTFDAHVDRHGNVDLEDNRTFDATDALMRAHGMDPYAQRKLAFLDRTRDQRAEMAREAMKDDLADDLAALGPYLTRIWKNPKWSLAERRTLYFQLWDECEEGDADLRAETGEAARRQIEKFIRRRLPAESPDAYTAAELAALNKGRLSQQRFAPYP